MSEISLNTSEEPNIKSMLIELDSGKLTSERSEEFLDIFELYECWTPFFQILQDLLKVKATQTQANFLRLARVQSLYLEEIDAAAQTCKKMVKCLPITYEKFNQEIIPTIIEKEEFILEAVILKEIACEFSDITDHVHCLERLCMLYEKKTYNESQLASTYEKLLEKDRKNIKALRYFKLVYTQSQDWENVANLLQDLMKSVKHKQEKFRVAQELAAVLLYHLDQPEDTIKIIKNCCAASPLDTTTIEFEAYYRMKDWKSCLNVLKNRMERDLSEEGKAVNCAKYAEICLKLNDVDSAKAFFEKAADHKKDYLDPLEKLVSLALDDEDWNATIKWLKILKMKSLDPDHIERLDQVIERIEGARNHGSSE